MTTIKEEETKIKDTTIMKYVKCGKEILSYWYYKEKGVVIILT